MGDRARWWATAGLLAVATAVWALATPLMTGADEADHAIRAAAAVRGHLLGPGRDLAGSPNVFVDVPVPEAYAGAPKAGACFVDYPGEGTGFAALHEPCVPMGRGTATVDAPTLQYRTQPTYHLLVGLGSFVPGPAGAYLMRLLSGLASALLLGAALGIARRHDGSGLLTLATLAGTTPVLVWLAGQVNAGGFEAAAAVGAWTATVALVARPDDASTRDVAAAAVGLSALALTRGLSPAFVAVVVAAAALARPEAVRRLAARRDVRRGAIAVAASFALSVAWLAFVTLRYPLADRPGTGLGHAIGEAWYFTKQAVAVFGSNDIVLPSWITVAWLLVAAAVVVAAWTGLTTRARLVVAAVAAVSVGLGLSAEAFSIPPIGYPWFGRYALPLVAGVPILAAGLTRPRPQPSPATTDRRPLVVGAAVLTLLHAVALTGALKHFAGRGDGTLGYLDALRHPRWQPPLLPVLLWPLVLAAAIAAASWLTLPTTAAPRRRRPAPPPPPPR